MFEPDPAALEPAVPWSAVAFAVRGPCPHSGAEGFPPLAT